jgi:hypothetical protein
MEEVMPEEKRRCAAHTKAGHPCKNGALAGSDYCFVHRYLGKAESGETMPPEPAPTTSQAVAVKPKDVQLDLLINELDALVQELQKRMAGYAPPPFSTPRLLALLQENIERIAPKEQLEILRELQRNLQDASAKDLVDPETWKGLWYILNALTQAQTSTLKESLAGQLASLPGMGMLFQLKGNLEGTSPKELLDVETWKGLWYIVTYTAQLQVQETKRRILGGTEGGSN